jgi:hypothetical protein
MLETASGDEISGFLMHLSHHAFQKCFFPLSVSTEQPDLSRVGDADHIISLLKQKAAEAVDDDRAGRLAMPRVLVICFAVSLSHPMIDHS